MQKKTVNRTTNGTLLEFIGFSYSMGSKIRSIFLTFNSRKKGMFWINLKVIITRVLLKSPVGICCCC